MRKSSTYHRVFDTPHNRNWITSHLHFDLLLVFLLILVGVMGLIIFYSASGTNGAMLNKQIIRLGLAFTVMFAVAQLPPVFFQRSSPVLFLVSVILLVLVLLVGDTGKGAQRWLVIAGLRFQPSEMMKIAMPMMIAWYLARHRLPPGIKHLIVSFVLIAIPTVLIAKEPDLGTAILVAASGITILFIAGLPWLLILGGLGIAGACAPVLWHFMREYQRNRVLTFLNPEQDPLGTGYHIIQSKIAIGSGGLHGKGWLKGTQTQLDFLPESSTDFIFSVFAEEFGLVGTLTLLVLYLCVVARGLVIAAQGQDSYSRLLAAGISLTFFVYVFVNIGMVSGILPVVGVPLPLISYGGTSMITLMLGFGILMSIQTHRKFIPS
ncbi:MAG: rod shape-determining protein RodA [Gammaproteobacteria bacterium]|nr:rod shape-determining protein RodA [Gammaproteobacteria bacterium]